MPVTPSTRRACRETNDINHQIAAARVTLLLPFQGRDVLPGILRGIYGFAPVGLHVVGDNQVDVSKYRTSKCTEYSVAILCDNIIRFSSETT